MQRLLHAKTETEAIERALDLIIVESERNRLTLAANDELLASGIAIRDVYGRVNRTRRSRWTPKA